MINQKQIVVVLIPSVVIWLKQIGNASIFDRNMSILFPSHNGKKNLSFIANAGFTQLKDDNYQLKSIGKKNKFQHTAYNR